MGPFWNITLHAFHPAHSVPFEAKIPILSLHVVSEVVFPKWRDTITSGLFTVHSRPTFKENSFEIPSVSVLTWTFTQESRLLSNIVMLSPSTLMHVPATKCKYMYIWEKIHASYTEKANYFSISLVPNISVLLLACLKIIVLLDFQDILWKIKI